MWLTKCYLIVFEPQFFSHFILFGFVVKAHRYMLSVNSWTKKLKSWEKKPKERRKDAMLIKHLQIAWHVLIAAWPMLYLRVMLFQYNHANFNQISYVTNLRTIILLITQLILFHDQKVVWVFLQRWSCCSQYISWP